MSDKTTSYPKEKIKILLLENISETAIANIHQHGYASIKKVAGALDEEALIKELKDVHLLGIRSKTRVTRKVLENAPKLQAIGAFCIGVNQIDLTAATQQGVSVFNAPYSNTRQCGRIGDWLPPSCSFAASPTKNKCSPCRHLDKKMPPVSFELAGTKTIGLVGYGNIGSQVSVLAEASGPESDFL
jgi:Phosphoglycerate dehydrogenase and related dehydrogenases